MITIKNLIKSILNSAGFDFKRINARSNASFQLLLALKKFEVDLVIDVGANIGQFASELRSIGYQGEIISFEPLMVAHKVLSNKVSHDSKWNAHTRCAVGDYDGQIVINVSGNSVSSSVLPMMPLHSEVAVGSTYISLEHVPIFKLDTVLPQYLAKSKYPILKIDTQGFEWQVLDGAREIMPKIKGIKCELSLFPLYEGQKLWIETIQRIESEGFSLWAIQPGFTDSNNGRTLQIDAIFFRL